MRVKQEQEWIVLRGTGSLSGLGASKAEIRQAYFTNKSAFTTLPVLGSETPVAPLSSAAEIVLQGLLQEEPTYSTLDRSVQMGVAAARQAVKETGWRANEQEPLGINIGSSRGATGLFEQFHADYLANPEQRLSPSTSPSTTLGNVASWVAHDLHASGPLISHSVTCSTALQAFANGLAWLKAGMAKRFLVGGTEAPLTPFTIAQMQAIGIYSKLPAHDFPCRPLNKQGFHTFALGEGAAIYALERMSFAEMAALNQESVVVVEAVGMGFERSPSKTGLSLEGNHFQKAMKNAFAQARVSPPEVDALVLHAPGTRAGDAAEVTAITQVFGKNQPVFYTNKTLIGHTLGASGALSVELALALLHESPDRMQKLSLSEQPSVPWPYTRILINSAGFGGNAASILLKKFSF